MDCTYLSTDRHLGSPPVLVCVRGAGRSPSSRGPAPPARGGGPPAGGGRRRGGGRPRRGAARAGPRRGGGGDRRGGAADDVFQVRIGASNAAGTAIQAEQQVRAGGTAVSVTVANSNAAVGQLEFGTGPAQSGTVTINVGQTRSPATVALNGVAFDPL